MSPYGVVPSNFAKMSSAGKTKLIEESKVRL